MNSKVRINKETKAIINANGQIKFLKYVDKEVIDSCFNDIKALYKSKNEKNVIFCIYKDNIFMFIDSHFPNKKSMRDSAKTLRNKGFVVWCYNG